MERDTIHHRVLARAEETPDAPFVTVLRSGASVSLTYGGLVAAAAGFASAYRERGVVAGDGIAVAMRQRAELFPAFLGALFVGAVPAFLPTLSNKQDPAIFGAAQDAVLARMRARVLIVDEVDPERPEASTVGASSVHGAQVLRVNEVPSSAPPRRVETASDGDVAFLQHSSGTTGMKKGVPLSQGTVLRQIDAYARAVRLSREDGIATWLPYYHDMGLIACFLLPAVHGLHVVVQDPFEWVLRPTSFLDLLGSFRSTLAWLPNFAFHHIVGALGRERPWDLSHVRVLVDSSEPCRPETLDSFYTALASTGLRREALQASYGMAENVFAVTQTGLGARPRAMVVDRASLAVEGRTVAPIEGRPTVTLLSCGKPIDTARIRIVGPDGAALSEGHVGRIAVSGSTLFSGYHASTAEVLEEDGWFTSADLGFVDGGELFVTGRMEDVLVISGRNLFAHDVEHAVNAHAGVKPGRCLAIGVYDAEKGTDALELVVEAPDGKLEPAHRKRIGQVVLSATGVPLTRVHGVPPGWLVKTTSGKVARRASVAKLTSQR